MEDLEDLGADQLVGEVPEQSDRVIVQECPGTSCTVFGDEHAPGVGRRYPGCKYHYDYDI